MLACPVRAGDGTCGTGGAPPRPRWDESQRPRFTGTHHQGLATSPEACGTSYLLPCPPLCLPSLPHPFIPPTSPTPPPSNHPHPSAVLRHPSSCFPLPTFHVSFPFPYPPPPWASTTLSPDFRLATILLNARIEKGTQNYLNGSGEITLPWVFPTCTIRRGFHPPGKHFWRS